MCMNLENPLVESITNIVYYIPVIRNKSVTERFYASRRDIDLRLY